MGSKVSSARDSVVRTAKGKNECFEVVMIGSSQNFTSADMTKDASDSKWRIANTTDLESAVNAGFKIVGGVYEESGGVITRFATSDASGTKKCTDKNGTKCYYFVLLSDHIVDSSGKSVKASPSTPLGDANRYIAYGAKPEHNPSLDYHILPFNDKKWSMYDKDAT